MKWQENYVICSRALNRSGDRLMKDRGRDSERQIKTDEEEDFLWGRPTYSHSEYVSVSKQTLLHDSNRNSN